MNWYFSIDLGDHSWWVSRMAVNCMLFMFSSSSISVLFLSFSSTFFFTTMDVILKLFPKKVLYFRKQIFSVNIFVLLFSFPLFYSELF